MKVIVCTGDSHTVGQGADSIKTATIPKNPNAIYNTAGKGISRGGNLQVPSYVNLVRAYIAAHTASEYTLTDGEALGEQLDCPVVSGAVLLQRELVLPTGWELHLICVAEQMQPAKMAVYVDDCLYSTEVLHTPIPRYNDWSFRNIPVFCKPGQQVRLVPLEGDVYISHIQHDRGEYAVVNSGIGSCTSRRYLDECFDYCVTAFRPDIIIAEGHTINDWLNYDDPHTHSATLNALLDKMGQLGARRMFVTVAPICGDPISAKFGKDYADFMAQAKTLADREDLVFVDANARFRAVLDTIPEEERFDRLYVDRWHVNGAGHRIYADAIIERLKEIL